MKIKNKKLILPEVDPITIFFSNDVMSYGQLQHYKFKLLEESSKTGEARKNLDLNLSGDFFQPAINCIINLQASLESFANRIIPEDYLFIDKTGIIILTSLKVNSNRLYQLLQQIWAMGLMVSWFCILDDFVNPNNDLNLVANML